jgi:hypothetical protein
MASPLNTKINSYPLERGIEFDQAYTTTPTQTGTNSAITFTAAGFGVAYQASPVGPPNGSGSWRFGASTNSAVSSRLTANVMPNANDRDFSMGFWFRITNIPASMNFPIFTHGSTNAGFSGFSIRVETVSAGSTYKVQFFTNGAPVDIATGLTANQWQYISVRRDQNNFYYFHNGTLKGTITNNFSQNITTTNFGFSVGSGGDFDYNISNFYYTDWSSVTPERMAEIWTVGSSKSAAVVETPATASALHRDSTVTAIGNAIISAVPLTASALQTEPLIATTIGDHIEITTSIPVSALMTPATVYVETFLNVTAGVAQASADLDDNIFAGGSTSNSFSSVPFLASAVLVQPLVAEVPMIASAASGDHTVYVDPNYFNAVMQLNPFVYIRDGLVANTINYGSQSGTFTRGADMDTLQDGGPPLNMVAEGLSWFADGSSNNSDGFITFTTSTAAQNHAQLVGNGTFALEFWAKPPSGGESYIQIEGILNLREVDSTSTLPHRIAIDIRNSATTTETIIAPHLTSFGNWNHFVVNVYQSGINANQRLVQVWVNGAIKINQNISFTPWTNPNTVNKIIGSNATGFDNNSWSYFDEIAWYQAPLTNSQITNHYELISTLSPDYNEVGTPSTANAQSGNHQFTVTSNAIPEIKEATASVLLVTPTFFAGVSINPNPTAITATAAGVIPQLSLGITASADPMIAYAESANAFHLNSIYSDYVIANVNPYRYVTFDSSTPTEDVGTDNDYSVVPTTIGGVIVNPDEGLNGKSAKTAGTSYVTDGVILKESEWDDTWGTGQANYHSSFWVQKALEDTSTGLRVLWNLNGYLDNQHVILFHYQNKLHLQFNNGSGTHLDAVTANNINIFNGERHFIVIAFDHTNNNNNLVNLYVNSVLVLTVNLGSYTGQTVNGTTFVGPNDEANNHPRLSVGCLITPFGETALPVVPTNTRLIIDEIYWAKTAINQTQVANLYNIMPDKDNNDSAADAMHASALMVDPAISTGVNHVSAVAIASALINEVTVTADRNIINLALPATASAELLNAERIDNVNIVADLFVASAIFNDAGVKITFPGGRMTATATLATAGIRINGINPAVVLPPWVAYLRATDLNNLMVQRGVN